MQRPWLSLAFALVASLSSPGDFGSDLGTLLTSSEPATFDAAPLRAVARDDDDARYDDTVQRTVHNAYERTEPLLDQLGWHGVRSLELDVHATKRGALAPSGDFWVYHADVPFGRGSSCGTLASCLAEVRAFHDVVPTHDVITLFVDLKDAPGGDRDARALDAVILRELGSDLVVTPRSLVDRCPGATSVRAAVTGTCAFPTKRSLRGRFIVVTTGGTACDAASPVSAYAREGALDRTAFVASNADASCPVAALDDPSRNHVAFVNLTLEERARAREARARGLVARVYHGGMVGGLDTPAELAAARRSGAQFLATDAVNGRHDPWVLAGSASARPLAGSADLPSSADGLLALHGGRGLAVGDVGDQLEALASVPSSHADATARACVFAKTDDGDDAEGVALCRPFAGLGPRFEVRRARGMVARTEGSSRSTGAGFLRLRFEDGDDDRTRVIAEASTDRRAWLTLGTYETAAPLVRRGIAVVGADSEASTFALVR